MTRHDHLGRHLNSIRSARLAALAFAPRMELRWEFTEATLHALDELGAYGFSKYIFVVNTLELRRLATALEDLNDPLNIVGVEQRERLEDLFSEVTRRFHNFSAGAKTLIDHTRNLMEEDFITEQHRSEYHAWKERDLAANPLVKFVQDFRNYLLHCAIPSIHLDWDLQAEKKTLNLDLTPMLTWTKWTVPSRAFIEAHKPAVQILFLVNQYEETIRSFHEAVFLSFETHYKIPLTEARSLMQQSNHKLESDRHS